MVNSPKTTKIDQNNEEGVSFISQESEGRGQVSGTVTLGDQLPDPSHFPAQVF